ncbi:hypothetical protein GGR50DRAFT_643890 [Xylaria sp. CBS 124048]|nr:hypothetical protein GGR50DRAFT_643890 [Xylaria sp. CBS 124048]
MSWPWFLSPLLSHLIFPQWSLAPQNTLHNFITVSSTRHSHPVLSNSQPPAFQTPVPSTHISSLPPLSSTPTPPRNLHSSVTPVSLIQPSHPSQSPLHLSVKNSSVAAPGNVWLTAGLDLGPTIFALST